MLSYVVSYGSSCVPDHPLVLCCPMLSLMVPLMVPLVVPLVFQITHWQSPHFHAYFPSASSYPALLADMLCGGLGCIGFTWVRSTKHEHTLSFDLHRRVSVRSFSRVEPVLNNHTPIDSNQWHLNAFQYKN